ncbi:MAG: C40 family peptidase [Hydrogenophilales bacterium]|nr:C40 family peptidase [Hydrogenophilales bacterium]
MCFISPAILAILLAISGFVHAESHAADPVAADAPAPAPATEKSQDLLLYALSLNGTSYKYGGRSADSGFDCSGFVAHVFRQAAGLALPHNARAISQNGEQITKTELKPGDLVFFNTLRRAFSHVGIYLGDNRFIHASSSSSGDVMVSDLTEKYWSKRFNGARRLALSE